MPAEAKPAGCFAAAQAARDFLTTFTTPGRILVAVSGGSDSIGLLLALHAAILRCDRSGFSLFACTVDHALRAGSAAEAQAVADLCAARGIPHVVRCWDGEKPSTGLQAAARTARYRLLADTVRNCGAVCVVTGHTRDDQIETVAMRRLRSRAGALESDVAEKPDSAPSFHAFGLSGMADAVLFERDLWVLRPFLSLSRAAVRAFLLFLGETWLDDPSNASDRFERVRIRRALSASPAPADGDDLSGEARERSSRAVAMLLAQHVRVFGGLVARIDRALTDNIDDPDGLRCVLILAAVLGGRPHGPGRETAARLKAHIAGADNGRMTAGRVVFDRRRSGLFLYREARDLPSVIIAPATRALWDGRFVVHNLGIRDIVVTGPAHGGEKAAGLIAAGLPAPVAKRAARAAFDVSSVNSPTGARNDPEIPGFAAKVDLRLAPWDTFLPRFDLMMANQCAVLFGRGSFPCPPVHDVSTEKRR